VAVNRDPHAPIFKVADFGVVADALAFLPAFILEVKNHLFQEIADLYRTQVKGALIGSLSRSASASRRCGKTEK
jgi:hypothetical protein